MGIVLAGCGSSGSKRTFVTPADLNRTGAFWLSLTGDLRQTLVGKPAKTDSDTNDRTARQIRATPPSRLVQQIDLQYENAAKRTSTIYSTYVGANDQLAAEKLRSLAPALEGEAGG